MSFWEALLYGAVQGLTEYLPISSSAHLILLPQFLKTKDPGLTFDVLLHLGTLLATLIYFRQEWLTLFQSFFSKKNESKELNEAKEPSQVRVSWLVLGTLPALGVGAFFHQDIETVLRGPQTIQGALVIGGIFLFLADRYSKKQKNLSELGAMGAFVIGLVQCLALIPGISRSGSTITAALFLGLNRASAAKFSFLLSAPVTLAAILYELKNTTELIDSAAIGWMPLMIALLSSFLFGWMAIQGLLKLVQRFSYLSFALYRVILAIAIGLYL